MLTPQNRSTMENNSTLGYQYMGKFELTTIVALVMFIFSILFFILFYLCCQYDRMRSRPLPTRSYTQTSESAASCVICLGDFEEAEVVKVIPGCGHIFHPGCIDRWLVGHFSCPVCRCSEIFDGEVVQEATATTVDIAPLVVEVGETDWEVRLERDGSLHDMNANGREVFLRRTLSF